MSRVLSGPSPWDVGRASAVCFACQSTIAPGTPCWAALVEGDIAPPAAAEPPPPAPAPDAAPEAKGSKKEKDKPAKPPAKPAYSRLDYCEACWNAGKRPEKPLTLFSFWKTSVPIPTAKKKMFVDDSVLLDLFGKLEGREAPQDVRFRFVLALILMRKRLLRYDGTERGTPPPPPPPEPPVPDDTGLLPPPPAPAAPPSPVEVWLMTPRGGLPPVKVTNPQLTPEQIGEVSQQLSTILAEEI